LKQKSFRFADSLDEFDEVLLLIAKKLQFLSAFLLLNLLSLAVALLNSFYLRFKLDNFILKFGLLSLKFLNFAFEVCLAMLSLELLSHSECD